MCSLIADGESSAAALLLTSSTQGAFDLNWRPRRRISRRSAVSTYVDPSTATTGGHRDPTHPFSPPPSDRSRRRRCGLDGYRRGGRARAAAVDGTPYLDLTSAVPRRVFDSRSTDAAHGGGRIHGGQTRTISVDIEVGPVNPGIFVAMTLTIVNTAGGGFLSVYPASLTSRPGISSINWSAPDQVYATGLITRTEIRTSLEEPARESFVKVYCGGGSTHFLLDLTARWRQSV